MIPTYKALSLLLDYPSELLQQSLTELYERLRTEAYLDEASLNGIHEFITHVENISLTEWQEQYVTLFDYSKGTNLYLFDHVYGSSKERGQAMVDLKNMYLESGFMPCDKELPDYLPLFLEFASIQSCTSDAESLLSEAENVLNNMKKAIDRQQTPYSRLIEIVHQLSCRHAKNSAHQGVEDNRPEENYALSESDRTREGGIL